MYAKVGYGILSVEKQLSILNYTYRAFIFVKMVGKNKKRERKYHVYGSSSELQEWEQIASCSAKWLNQPSNVPM